MSSLVCHEFVRQHPGAIVISQSLFSFNSKGACEACGGTGRIVYDMAFAEPVEVVCEQCGGHRYSKTALGYTYKGRNIEDALNLTMDEPSTGLHNKDLAALRCKAEAPLLHSPNFTM